MATGYILNSALAGILSLLASKMLLCAISIFALLSIGLDADEMTRLKLWYQKQLKAIKLKYRPATS
jgi:hypothetical protein